MIKRLNIILALIICIALCGSGGSLSFFGFAPDGSGNWVQNIAGTKIIISTNNAGNDGIVIGTTTLLAGQQLRLFNGNSGAIKPTNIQFEIDTSSNGGADIASASATTTGYYFSNPTAAYDGGMQYNNTSRIISLRAGSSDRLFASSTGITTPLALFQFSTATATDNLITTASIDGADSNSLQFSSGSTVSTARGAEIEMYGNENGNTGILALRAGNVTGGSVIIGTNGGSTITVAKDLSSTFAGKITSNATADLGWSVQSAANQACNTTCTSACVFGFNLTAGVPGTLLACTDATADVCLCAGAS